MMKLLFLSTDLIEHFQRYIYISMPVGAPSLMERRLLIREIGKTFRHMKQGLALIVIKKVKENWPNTPQSAAQFQLISFSLYSGIW